MNKRGTNVPHFHLVPKLWFGNGITREALLPFEEAELLKFVPSQAAAWDGETFILILF